MPETDPPPIINRPLTPDEQELENQIEWDRIEAEDQARMLHALFSNRIFIQPDGMHLRLTFGEQVKGEPRYHTSIVVPNGDALQFGQLLAAMAQQSLDAQLAFYREALASERGESDGE